MTATRHNKGKTDLTLLPVEACIQESKVWMYGEEKYGRENWKKLWGDDTVNVVMASLLRHAFAIVDGEILDPESGLDHSAHIRANAAMILEYRKRQNSQKESVELGVKQDTNFRGIYYDEEGLK